MWAKKHSLPHLTYELGKACNYACTFCFQRNQPQSSPIADYSQSMQLLRQLYKNYKVGQLTFSGGEPTLSARLSEQILYAARRGSNIALISNASANPEHYAEYIECGLGLIQFTLAASTAKKHDAVMRHPGAFRKLIKNIKALQTKEVSLCVALVLRGDNVEDLAEMLNLLHQLRVKQIMLNRYNPGSPKEFNKQNIPEIEALKQSYQLASAFRQKTGIQITSNVAIPRCLLDPADYPGIQFSQCHADISQRPLTLQANGDLRFCNHSPQIIGNLYTQKLSDILQQTMVLEWKDSIPEICKDCPHWEKCYGGCRAVSQLLGQGLQQVDPILKYWKTGEI